MQLEAAIHNYVNTVGGGLGTLLIVGVVILGFVALARWALSA